MRSLSVRALPRWGSGADVGLPGGLILAAGVACAMYLILVPLGMLLTAAFRVPGDFLPFEPGTEWSLDNVRVIYTDPVIYAGVIPDTIVFTAGSVAVCFVIAFALAWLVERTDLPARDTLFTLILFPLMVPGVVLAIAWILLFGPNAGYFNWALQGLFGLEGPGPLDIFSMGGLIMSQAMASVPFVFLLLSATLRQMNPALEEASATSGATPLRTFFRVTVPVLRPGILAPVILVTLITLEQFEMPLLIGLPAHINVFSARIFWELNPISGGLPFYGRAAAVALPFLAFSMVLLLLYNRLIRQAEHYVTITGRGYRPNRYPLGRWRWPAVGGVLAYVAVAGVMPAGVLLWTSLFGFEAASMETLPPPSLEAYGRLFGDATFYRALGNTVTVAGGSAAIVTVLGALLGWIIVRTRFKGRPALDFLSFMSVGIPSVIAALAALLLYSTVQLGVYGTIWILVLAYSYRIAVTTRMSRAGLMQVHRELEEASHISGGAWLATVRRVVLPLLMPSLLGGFILLFIIGVREFTMGLVLYSRENIVFSVLLWQLYEQGNLADASALAVLTIVLVIPVIFAARQLLRARAESV